MTFLNPWLLLGALGISVPIAIHLLNRFRPKRIEWGAMRLLRQALVQRSRQVKLEDLLLLILRCLAILLLALALARPTLESKTLSSLTGGRHGAVIAIDASYSMEATAAAQSRFARAVSAAEHIADTLPPGSPLSVVLMGDRPQVLLRDAGYQPSQLRKLLGEAAPMMGGLNLERSLDEVASLAEAMDGPSREVHLITDGQKIDWADLPARTRKAMRQIAKAGRLYIEPIEATRDANLAITDLHLAGGTPRLGGTVRYEATVHNYGTTAAHEVAVRLHLAGVAVDQQTVANLDARASASVSLFATLKRVGPIEVKATLAPDALMLDNARYAVLDVRRQVRVLLVDGQPGNGQAFSGETDFLRTALSPNPQAAEAASLDVRSVSWLNLTGQSLTGEDVVVLANVADVPAQLVEPLRQFVQRGGGLILMPGDQVQPAVFNARFASAGIVGGTLAAPIEDRNHPAHLAVVRDRGPIGRLVADAPTALRQQVTVDRWFPIKPAADDHVVLTLDHQGGRYPLLVSRPVGAGRVLLFAIPADRAWSDWVTNPIYVMLMHQALSEVVEGSSTRQVLVGQALPAGAADQSPKSDVQSPTAGAAEGTLRVQGPLGKTWKVTPAQAQADRTPASLTARLPGVYTLADGGGTGGGGRRRLVAANVDTHESNIASLDRAGMTEAVSDLPVTVLSTGGDLAGRLRQHRLGVELWWPLAALSLLLFVLESYLAKRFTRRLSSGEGRRSLSAADVGTATPAESLAA